MAEYQVGSTYTTGDGRTARFDGENWVLQPMTGTQEMAHGAIPFATQAAAGTYGMPGALRDLAAAGLQKAGKAIGPLGFEAKRGELPTPRTGEALWGPATAMREINRPSTPSAMMERAQARYPNADLGFQPETRLGKYTQGAINAAPAAALTAATGGASLLPLALKTGSSVIGGVEGSNIGEMAPDWMQPYAKTAGGIMGSILGFGGPGGVTKMTVPKAVTAARRADVDLVRKEAGKGAVDAAQATDSPRLRGAIGPPNKGQPVAITQAMLRHGDINWDPETGMQGITKAVNGELQAYSHNHGLLEKQTQLTPTTQLKKDWDARLNAYGGRQPEDVATVQDKYNKVFGPKSPYGPRLSGPEYIQLRDELRGANHPVLRDMADDLDRELSRQDPAVAAQWTALRQKRANLEGLNYAAQKAIVKNKRTLDPADVYSGMDERAQTPLKRLAAAANVTQQTIEPDNSPGIMSHLLTGLGSAAGYLGGGYAGSHGFVPGLGHDASVLSGLAGSGVVGPITGAAVYGARRGAARAAAPFLENPGELRNMDPKTASQLLLFEQPAKTYQQENQ